MGLTDWFIEVIQLLQQMIVVIDVMLLVSKHNAIQIRKISIEIYWVIVCSSN